jgi:hypothetical protein
LTRYCWRNHDKATRADCTPPYGRERQDQKPASVRVGATRRADSPARVLLPASPANSPTVSDPILDSAGVVHAQTSGPVSGSIAPSEAPRRATPWPLPASTAGSPPNILAAQPFRPLDTDFADAQLVARRRPARGPAKSRGRRSLGAPRTHVAQGRMWL